MSIFFRLLNEADKAASLLTACNQFRNGHDDIARFEMKHKEFKKIPGMPFAYWTSSDVRNAFTKYSPLEGAGRTARQGLATAEDFRFVRLFWEVESSFWSQFAKGGVLSPFYSDIYLCVNWENDGSEIKAGICRRYPYLNGNAEFVAKNTGFYYRRGLTWPNATTLGISVRVLPDGCVFGHMGPSVFSDEDRPESLLCILSIMNSRAFSYFIEMQLALAAEGRKHYEVGVLQRTPFPTIDLPTSHNLGAFALKAWSLKRPLDQINETSHAFTLPTALRTRLGDYDPPSIEAELAAIQTEIDDIAFDLYGFSDADRLATLGSSGAADEDASDPAEEDDDSKDDDVAEAVDQTDGLLSWAAGVAFGRFDWRLATGEREAPPEPKPFDPLPAKSPGMLPDGADPFYAHSGVLVDDQGHPNDLARLIEEVLARVDAPVPADVRRWLQRDFFPLHLRQYSKSRRKAPIYWPLSTSSGSYTLWLYYPSLTDQTLFTAVNDFIEPKLKQVDQDVAALRTKGSSRSRDDEKTFESLQALELELIELRDTLLAIAQTYRPNHDDGVQITAAPLWQLFRHKPWQKILKDTWAKLEKGDYDWAHLALAYWPDRVREKCETDKSLAIAHDLEHLYVEPEPKPTKARGRKKASE